MFTLLSILAQNSLHFGGEDPVNGDPWHHEDLSRKAAVAAQFDGPAADDVAWHADYIDSYLYNPLWWAPGGVPRLKASLAGGPLLKNLHFDDLFSPGQVLTMWRRYTSGTLAGLIWAWQRQDVAAARHCIGVSLHAIQDFYAHSNWVDDPARRSKTFLEMSAAERLSQPLWTGSYELPDHAGIKPHGKPAPWCGLLGHATSVMDIMCHAASPLSSGPLCAAYRACRDSEEARPETILDVPVPKGVFYLAPPGIALDSTWQAEIGVKVRGLTDVTGAALFETATELATRTSAQWLSLVEDRLTSLGAQDFWTRITKDPSTAGERERQFEDFARFPYGFAAVGSYPPPLDENPDEWYLRVQIATANESGAGTDADIIVRAGGADHVLDYMPKDNPLLAYNDFEAGDDQAYYIGPFAQLPSSISLFNRSASAGDVFSALGTAFVRAVQSAIDSVAAFLFELIGGPADLVGNTKRVWTPAQLASLPDNVAVPFDLRVDGRSEGRYRISGSIRRTQRIQEGARGWSDYVVRLDTLFCEKESEWDRGTSDDEPFVLALLINQAPGQVHRVQIGPFSGVDKGESRTLGHTFPSVRVPDDVGYLTLPVQVLESDDESRKDRQRALAEFAGEVTVDVAGERERFLTTLGRAVAADWKVSRVEVFAFKRGRTVSAGPVHQGQPNQWVRGGGTLTLPLSTQRLVTVDSNLELTTPAAQVVDLLPLASQARWQGARLTDASGNSIDGQDLPFNGSDGDSRGFVRLEPVVLEDGRTTTALWTHPMWVDNGTIKGWHPDVLLPTGARFEALVGFRAGALYTDGVRFVVFEHHTEDGGRRVWNQVLNTHKPYTRGLMPVSADLSHLGGKKVGIELRVDAGPSSGQDWAVWVAPRIVGT